MSIQVRITDELREWANRATHREDYMPGMTFDLMRIADRIDATHKHGIEYVADYDKMTMAKHGWIKMPVDADGKLIDAGHETTYGKVDYIKSSSRGWEVVISEGPCAGTYHPSVLHHAPTVEDVLREFGDWYAHVKGGCDEDGIITEYAKKLRLAGEDA